MKVWVLFLKWFNFPPKSFPDGSVVKNLPAVQETWVWSLQDPLEKEMETYSTHSSIQYGCESWTVKKAEHWRTDAFELWCGRRLLRIPWTARRSNQSILKEISPENSLEGLMLKLKLQYFGQLMWITDSFEKNPDAGKDWMQQEKGTTEVEMVGWHHWLDRHKFEWGPGVVDGEGSQASCSSWDCKESDTTEPLNWLNKMNELLIHVTSHMKFGSIMLSEWSQLKQITYCMISFIWNVQIRQINGDEK